MTPNPLPETYYHHSDVLFLAQDLLGKRLYTLLDGVLTGGAIVETEAYRGPEDRASHAYNNHRTQRNEAMYQQGGITYVYLCYGIHNLFNIVTYTKDIPHAILIRAIEPLEGIDMMLKRRNKTRLDRSVAGGPGALCQALKIDRSLNAIPLNGSPVWIEKGAAYTPHQIIASPRIGVDYAQEDALLPWRFRVKDSPWTSRPF